MKNELKDFFLYVIISFMHDGVIDLMSANIDIQNLKPVSYVVFKFSSF